MTGDEKKCRALDWYPFQYIDADFNAMQEFEENETSVNFFGCDWGSQRKANFIVR
jgi:hypothetical protein